MTLLESVGLLLSSLHGVVLLVGIFRLVDARQRAKTAMDDYLLLPVMTCNVVEFCVLLTAMLANGPYETNILVCLEIAAYLFIKWLTFSSLAMSVARILHRFRKPILPCSALAAAFAVVGLCSLGIVPLIMYVPVWTESAAEDAIKGILIGLMCTEIFVDLLFAVFPYLLLREFLVHSPDGERGDLPSMTISRIVRVTVVCFGALPCVSLSFIAACATYLAKGGLDWPEFLLINNTLSILSALACSWPRLATLYYRKFLKRRHGFRDQGNSGEQVQEVDITPRR